jgi:OOP family OmpA-OmpF porin
MKKSIGLIAAIAGGLAVACGPSQAQERITYQQALQGLAQSAQTAQKIGIDTDAVRQDIEARIKADGSENAKTAPSVADALSKLPNFIVQIQFNLDSDIIRPESWVTVGRIADALQHPLVLGDRFLIVGNTDARGSREYNLELSQKRARSVAFMLVNVFGVQPNRLATMGLGEEALFDKNDPDAAVNRRVELYNIGPL